MTIPVEWLRHGKQRDFVFSKEDAASARDPDRTLRQDTRPSARPCACVHIRMLVHHSNFTIHDTATPLEDFLDSEQFLLKFEIPAATS